MLNVNFIWLNAGVYTEHFIYAPAWSVRKRKALLQQIIHALTEISKTDCGELSLLKK